MRRACGCSTRRWITHPGLDHKRRQKAKKEFTKEQLDYAAADVFVLPQIMKLQRTYIRLYKLDKIAAIEFTLVESVAHMELIGFQIDKEKYDLVLLDNISVSVPFNQRPKAIELVKLINERKVEELVVEEFRRLGRNTGDVIRTLEWLEDYEINVVVRNVG